MHVSFLNTYPRKVNLLSTVDGNVYTFNDDGITNGRVNSGRKYILDNLNKRHKNSDTPVYVQPVDGKLFQLHPMFQGEVEGDTAPISPRKLDDQIKSKMNQALVERKFTRDAAVQKLRPEIENENKKRTAEGKKEILV